MQNSRKTLPSTLNPAMCSDCRQRVSLIPLGPGRNLILTNTPDILFVEPVLINGTLVNWIDLKAYYASFIIVSDNRYSSQAQVSKGQVPMFKVKGQIERYNQAYGPGALLFLRGFHINLVDGFFKGTLLLDASSFDISQFDIQN